MSDMYIDLIHIYSKYYVYRYSQKFFFLSHSGCNPKAGHILSVKSEVFTCDVMTERKHF